MSKSQRLAGLKYCDRQKEEMRGVIQKGKV